MQSRKILCANVSGFLPLIQLFIDKVIIEVWSEKKVNYKVHSWSCSSDKDKNKNKKLGWIFALPIHINEMITLKEKVNDK